MTDLDDGTNTPLFRAAKRRKVFRKRQEDEGAESLVPSHPTSPHRPSQTRGAPESHLSRAQREHDGLLSASEVLRRRKLGKSRRAGIEFSNINLAHHGTSSILRTPDAAAAANENRSVVDIAATRFAPQTGEVAEITNKHMMAELREEVPVPETSAYSVELHSAANSTGRLHGQRQPAGLGKLHEIDLGPDATLRNIERTEAATRRLENGEVVGSEESRNRGKVRLGRDGKPWRGRKRRNSDDIKRDKLVEEVLKETRLDLYDEPDAPTDATDDQAADDRIAEQFRREFLDAIQNRNIRRTAPAPPGTAKGAKSEERPKGPKLGGSRSARAAMRAREGKAAKKK